MTQKTLEELNRSPSDLKEEIKALRSFMIGILGRDREGEYKPDFVRKVLKAARAKAILTFKNKRNFLKQLRKKYKGH